MHTGLPVLADVDAIGWRRSFGRLDDLINADRRWSAAVGVAGELLVGLSANVAGTDPGGGQGGGDDTDVDDLRCGTDGC